MRNKVTKQCPQTTTFEEKGEPKQIRTEVLLLTSLTPYRLAKPAHTRSVGVDVFYTTSARTRARLRFGFFLWKSCGLWTPSCYRALAVRSVCIRIMYWGLFITSLIVQELCESRGGRPGLSVLTSLLVSVDVKIYCTVLRHWSQLVPNMSHDIWGH